MSADGATVRVVGVGYTGRRLLAALETAIGLSRSGSDDPGATIVRLDLDVGARPHVDSGAGDAIVYTVPPARSADHDTRLERLLAALETPPRRFVYLSTTGVYGNRDGALVDESSTLNPESSRARRRVAAETALTAWCEHHKVALVILRVPGIYGPGRLGQDRIRDGAAVLRESDANPGNRIHVDDLVRCIIAAIRDETPAGIYNVGDGDSRSSTWFTQEVARQLGLPPAPTITRAAATRQFPERRLSFLRESRRVDLTRMRDYLQTDIRYTDAADGIAASIAEESRDDDRS